MNSADAVRTYTNLIGSGQYSLAWAMLSAEFRASKGNMSYETYVAEWAKSGPAVIVEPLISNEWGDSAEITVTWSYPAKSVTHRLVFNLHRNYSAGHPHFGYWMFMSSTLLW